MGKFRFSRRAEADLLGIGDSLTDSTWLQLQWPRGTPLNEPTLTSRTVNFVAQNWGNLASVAGLILAGASAYFARRASASAEQARKAILSSTLAEESSTASKLAGEITELIEFGKHEFARLRCGDLHDKTVMILKRWDADLSEESKNNCLNAKAQLEVLRVGVLKFAAAAVEPTPRQLLQMKTACMRIKEIFVVEHASAMRRDDEARNA